MGAILPDGEPYGQEDKRAADEKRAIAKLLKECKSAANVNSVTTFGKLMPILLLMAQVQGSQGLSLAAPVAALWDLETFYTATALLGIGLVTVVVFLGLPYSLLKFLKWGLGKFFKSAGKVSRETQTEKERALAVATQSSGRAHQAKQRAEERFIQEYVDRCTDLEALLSQRCREIQDMERALYDLRAENRDLRARLERQARRVPAQICVATSRGERYHLPGCGNIRRSGSVQHYTPCQACLGG